MKTKELNMSGFFQRGYAIVQKGGISFELINKDNAKLIEFDISERDEDLPTVHTFLLSEIDYTISEIEPESDSYFQNEFAYVVGFSKEEFLEELKLIGDILR